MLLFRVRFNKCRFLLKACYGVEVEYVSQYYTEIPSVCSWVTQIFYIQIEIDRERWISIYLKKRNNVSFFARRDISSKLYLCLSARLECFPSRAGILPQSVVMVMALNCKIKIRIKFWRCRVNGYMFDCPYFNSHCRLLICFILK